VTPPAKDGPRRGENPTFNINFLFTVGMGIQTYEKFFNLFFVSEYFQIKTPQYNMGMSITFMHFIIFTTYKPTFFKLT